jgi:2-oxoglutarate dehydrogenase E1 component
MYEAIARQPTTRAVYTEKLIAEGAVSREEADEMRAACRRRLDADFEASASYKPNKADWLEGHWSKITVAPSYEERKGKTDVAVEFLKEVGQNLLRVPDGFHLHPRLNRFFEARRKMIETGQGVDWATAEALAFGTLLREGTLVRMSGQDSSRGTFSQRHSVLFDQKTQAPYIPLANLAPDQARFVTRDSPLSEAGVLGFEYGMSLADPDSLYLWEAQFGDFANGAQFIVDQFIASSEAKWLRMSAIVMLLPHGFEGQGPEHSSARLERYLQLCAEDNLQVVNVTTPANYFHALRRQVRRSFRKPLIVMTPKSLLRHRRCVSTLADMGPGTSFRRVLTETTPGIGVELGSVNEKVRRVVLCSGKVYYDLLAEREKRQIQDVALVRLEQLYPFPSTPLGNELKKFPAAEVVWCQEEPYNMGAWSFADRRIEDLLATLSVHAKRPVYVGRPAAASPATGLHELHEAQQAKLVDDALAPGRQAAA